MGKCLKNDLSSNFKKVTKIKVRITSKPHAYLLSMVKTSVKFQKNPNITVGEVVCTRDPLSIHFHCVNVEKVLESKLKLRKKCQKLI